MCKVTAILVATLVACTLGQDYVLKGCVVDAGGSQTSSSGYVAKLSFGQPIASNAITGSGYRAVLGFWHPGHLVGVQEPVLKSSAFRPVFALGQNVPNPFNRRAIINYSLPAEAEVDLRILDRCGRVITTLVSGRQKAGRYRVTWSLDSWSRAELANGVYFYRLTAGDNTATRKMVKME